MKNDLAQQAVTMALNGNWAEALSINLQILEINLNDVDALNRLARCYAELGEKNKAIESSEKVLKLDPANTIAQRCLFKWKNVIKKESKGHDTRPQESFLEESGKTKIVQLLNLGDSSLFANLDSGDEVKLSAHAHKVSVIDISGKYIGRLPDDVAARLRSFIKNGVKYQVLVKSIDLKNVSVFIRELDNKTGLLSFPPEKIDYVSFTPPELVHKDTPEMANIEEVSE